MVARGRCVSQQTTWELSLRSDGGNDWVLIKWSGILRQSNNKDSLWALCPPGTPDNCQQTQISPFVLCNDCRQQNYKLIIKDLIIVPAVSLYYVRFSMLDVHWYLRKKGWRHTTSQRPWNSRFNIGFCFKLLYHILEKLSRKSTRVQNPNLHPAIPSPHLFDSSQKARL